MNPALRAALGGLLSVGSALSIPFDFRAAVKQVQSAVLVLMDEHKIQEMVARQSNSASTKAFSMSSIVNGGILGTELLGVPHAMAEAAFVGLSPSMENLLKMGWTVADLKNRRPTKMGALREMGLANHRLSDPVRTSLLTPLPLCWLAMPTATRTLH